MPISPDYQNYSATLRIFGNIRDMKVLSTRLGMEATQIYRKGDLIEGTAESYPMDSWEITAAVKRDRSLEDHLAWLKSRLMPRGAVLRDIKTALSVDVFCQYRSNHSLGGFSLPTEALLWLTELGLGLEIAVIVDSPRG